jgi:hypothetical protein
MSMLSDFLAIERSQLGVTEDPAGSNHTRYGEWYGMDRVAWCAIFQSWAAWQVGAIQAGVIPKHAYTPTGAQWFKARGQWGSEPRVGALAYFNISGMGRISHIGAVEKLLGGPRFYSLEGNTNSAGGRTGGQVLRQVRSNMGPGGGFAYPKWPGTAVPMVQAGRSAPLSAPSGPAYPGVVLKRGSKGETVRVMQDQLRKHLVNGYGKTISTDGDFGPATEAAVRWYQECRHGAPFRLDVDGQVGPATWRSLWQ